MAFHAALGIHVIDGRPAGRQRVGGSHLLDVHHQLRIAVVQGHIAVGGILARGDERVAAVEGLRLVGHLIGSAEVGLCRCHIVQAVEAGGGALHVGRLAVTTADGDDGADTLGGDGDDGTAGLLIARQRRGGEILGLRRGDNGGAGGVERQVNGQLHVLVAGIGSDNDGGVARLREIGRPFQASAKGGTDARHARHELGKLGHHIAALGDGAAAASSALAVAHHGIVALSGIVNPGVEVAQHAGVDSAEEVEEVLREVVVAGIVFHLVPVDKVLRHPYFLALSRQVLVGRLDAAILVTAVDVEAVDDVGLVEGVGIGITDGQRLWSHNLAADGAAVGLHERGNVSGRPHTAGIRSLPVGLVLDGDGIQFDAVLSEVLHVILQILGVVAPVLLLQVTQGAVAVLGVAGAVGLPLGGLSPRRGKDDEPHLLGQLRRSQRLAPGVFTNRNIQAHDVAPHGARLTPHLLDFGVRHVVIGKLGRADEAAEARYLLMLGLSIKSHSSTLCQDTSRHRQECGYEQNLLHTYSFGCKGTKISEK